MTSETKLVELVEPVEPNISPVSRLPRCWYLIQRLNPADDWRRKNETKLDRCFSCDYMGSAEFEWGAVSDAARLLRAMAAQGDLIPKKFAIKGPNSTVVSTWVICHKDADEPELVGKLSELSRSSIRLKEPAYYDECFVKPDFDRTVETHGWLVLDHRNPLFFFVDENMANDVWRELHTERSI